MIEEAGKLRIDVWVVSRIDEVVNSVELGSCGPETVEICDPEVELDCSGS